MWCALAVPSARRVVGATMSGIEAQLALLTAIGMMCGSLYMSEVAEFIPCRFCWFQRIAAYPVVVILAFGVRRRDRNAWAPTLTLAGIGALLSCYHLALEHGVIADSGGCDPAAPCTVNWLDSLGVPFITIPFMALCCFVFIGALGTFALRNSTPTTQILHSSPVEFAHQEAEQHV